MRKILLALSALAVAGIATPAVQSASAETVVVKKTHHDRDWGRHHKKVVVIKRGRHHDHD